MAARCRMIDHFSKTNKQDGISFVHTVTCNPRTDQSHPISALVARHLRICVRPRPAPASRHGLCLPTVPASVHCAYAKAWGPGIHASSSARRHFIWLALVLGVLHDGSGTHCPFPWTTLTAFSSPRYGSMGNSGDFPLTSRT